MTERREFLGAMAALFTGVLLPPPIRDSLMVNLKAPSKDAFVAVMHQYYQLALVKPPPRRKLGIIRAEQGFIPEPSGPEVSYVLATADEIAQLHKPGYDPAAGELVAKLKARPFSWDRKHEPPPYFGAEEERCIWSDGTL